MRRLFTWELSVRVCQDEWVRVCVLQDKRGEELLLVRPRTTYWASRTSSERARTREASRTWQHNHQGRSAEKQSIPCEVGPGNHWEDKLEPKPIRQHVKRDRGNVLNTCRELGQTRDKGSRWRGSPWIPWWRPTQTEAQYLSCYASVPKKEGGIFDILIRFTLKKRGLFKDGVNSNQSLVWAE